MSGASVDLLDRIVESKRVVFDDQMELNDYFEFFAAEQILKDYDTGYEDIDSGLVDGGDDGGIDGCYIIVDGRFVDTIDDLIEDDESSLDLIVFQAKNKNTFNENPVIKAKNTISMLLSGDKSAKGRFAEAIIEKFSLFRDVYNKLVMRYPKVGFRYCYVSKGDVPHQKVIAYGEDLRKCVKDLLPDAEVLVSFVGARELVEMYRKKQERKKCLKYTSIIDHSDVACAAIVQLPEYYNFISDDGKLLRWLFDENVRDFCGCGGVNSEIKATLDRDESIDFWCLNNGISVITEEINRRGSKVLELKSPFIVNGLQTSNVIYSYYRGNSDRLNKEERSLLVKIIQITDRKSMDRVIKATNSQTSVPVESLRATEEIQYNVEDCLRGYGLCYDRRKNYYKNEGIAKNKVVGIKQMAQSVISGLLQRPDMARARPGLYIKRDHEYVKIFNTEFPVDMYGKLAHAFKMSDNALRSYGGLSKQTQNDLKFYILSDVIVKATSKIHPNSHQIASVEISDINNVNIASSIMAINNMYVELGATERVAKGVDLLKKMKEVQVRYAE